MMDLEHSSNTQKGRTAALSSASQDIVIEPVQGWQLIDVKELLHYKGLLRLLVQRDIRLRYKQTVFGFAWAIIKPFFTMIVFSVIFGRLAQLPSDGVPYPVFSYVALVPWTYFSGSVAASTRSLLSNMELLRRVYFPRLILPITPLFTHVVDFSIALTMVFGMMAYYGIAPTPNIVFLPLLVLLMAMTAGAVGMWLSSLALQYRDIPFALGFMIQIMMYAAPVVWPISLVPDEYRLVYGIYPMAGVIEGFRSALLGINPMPWDLIAIGAAGTLVVFVTGAFFFRRQEMYFADVS